MTVIGAESEKVKNEFKTQVAEAQASKSETDAETQRLFNRANALKPTTATASKGGFGATPEAT